MYKMEEEEAGTGDVNCASPLLPIPVSAAVRALTRLNPTSSRASSPSSTPPTKGKSFARHRHSHSLGLLTPTASSSSLSGPPSANSLSQSQAQSLASSSTSLNSLSPSPSSAHPYPYHNPYPYHTPHTPLRSSTYPSTSAGPSPSSGSRSNTHRPSASTSTAPAPASLSPRSSLLFQRLLQPFVRSTAPSTTTAAAKASLISSSATEDSEAGFFDDTTSNNHNYRKNDMAALHYYRHQPTSPHMYQSPAQNDTQPSASSSTHPGSMPTSPPSRSEQLLRDALMRDGLERSTPSASSSSPNRPSHKRRHSHVPTTSSASTFEGATSNVGSPLSPAGEAREAYGDEGGVRGGEAGRRESRMHRERRREQYTGSFLFRTAMSSTSVGGVSLSPEPDHEHEEGGSDLSASLLESVSGSGSGSGKSGHGTRGGRSYYGGDAESVSGGGSMMHGGHGRSASVSPSPVRRRAGFTSAAEQQQAQARWQMQTQFLEQQQQRGAAPRSPLPPSSAAQTKSPQGRTTQAQASSPYPQSPRSPRRPQSQPREKGKGSPLPMTPHEQVLRARLERVLEVGRVVQEREQQQQRARSQSKSGVRDRQQRQAGSGDGVSVVSGSGSSQGHSNASGGERRGRSGGRARSTGGSRSRGTENEVLDEQGGWPWKEKGRGSGGAEEQEGGNGGLAEVGFGFGLGDAELSTSPMSLSIASLPKPAGSSQNLNHSQPFQQPVSTANFSPRRPERQSTTPSHAPMTPSNPPSTPSRSAFTPGHGRTRSKTGPEASVPNSPSPRRNTTLVTPSRGATSASRIPVRMDTFKLNGSAGVRGGDAKTKNAVSTENVNRERGTQKQNREQGAGVDDYDEEDELRLLTPPPTPPFTARAFSSSHALPLAGNLPAASVFGEYCPSPYKSSYSAGIQQQQHHYTPTKGSGLGKGLNGIEGPRRPANAPVSSSSASSSSSVSDGSEPHSPDDAVLDGPFLSPAVNRLQYLQKAHEHHQQHFSMPSTATGMSPSTRPAFNARKASESCRAMQGYVSFSNIEGLGEPPGADDEGGAGGSGAGGSGSGGAGGIGGGVLGAAWGGWRRLLGVAGSGTQAHEEGVVL